MFVNVISFIVYKGTVVNLDGSEREVAVKVRHPSVTAAIDDDLDLLRLAVRLLGKLPFDAFKNLRWLNPEGVVEEFADLLKLQLDFRNEADHLVRFNKNFRNNPDVLFPEVRHGLVMKSDVQNNVRLVFQVY